MDYGLFIQGIIIGLTLAVPVGPISLVCIHRTVANGRLHGMFRAWGCHRGLVLRGSRVPRPDRSLRADHRPPDPVPSSCGNRPDPCRDPGLPVRPAAVSEGDGQEPYLQDYLSLSRNCSSQPADHHLLYHHPARVRCRGTGDNAHCCSALCPGIFLGRLWWIILCGSLGSVRSRLSTENLR